MTTLLIADILKIEIVTLGIVFYIQSARGQVDIYWPTLHTFGIRGHPYIT